MKKLFVVFIVLGGIVFSNKAFAQSETSAVSYPRHEVGISYGVLPNSQIMQAFADIFSGVSKAVLLGMFGVSESKTYSDGIYAGPVNAEYFYNASPVLGVGGMFIGCFESQDVLYGGDKVGNRKRGYYTLMPAVKLNWLRRQGWGMYSKFGAGATFLHFNEKVSNSDSGQSESDVSDDLVFNFHASLMGVEFGGNFRGFVEFGIGEQGIVSAGLRYQIR